MDNNLLKRDGYNFSFIPSACESCGGVCCVGESGYIWVKHNEIKKIACFLDLTIEEFARIYLKKVKNRYSIIEKKVGDGNYACIFFDGVLKKCKIYSVRPLQCSTFPFWEMFKNNIEEVKKECIGVV